MQNRHLLGGCHGASDDKAPRGAQRQRCDDGPHAEQRQPVGMRARRVLLVVVMHSRSEKLTVETNESHFSSIVAGIAHI